MPGRLAIAALAATALAAAVAGCAQPGTPVSSSEAAKLGVGTSDISDACGYLEELTAFGGHDANALSSISSMAQTGARKVAAVYARDQTGIYQGESVGAVLGDSISLLDDCRLRGAEQILQHELAKRR